MKNRIGDKDVLQVLTSIKNSEAQYPKDLAASRRDVFTKQAAAMAVLLKASVNGTGANQTAETASTTSSGAATGAGSLSMSTLLETLLVIALVTEAGVATYVYREKIAEFFNSIFGPRVEQVSSPTNNSPEILVSDEPTASELPDETATATETPLPLSYTPPTQANDDSNGSGNPQTKSTPDPNDDDGKHLGQTKQPSKESKQNINNDSKDK